MSARFAIKAKMNLGIVSHLVYLLKINMNRPKAKRYKEMEVRLLSLCRDRASGQKTAEEALSGIAHNIRWTPCNRAEDYDEQDD